jgi:hypothetical protein
MEKKRERIMKICGVAYIALLVAVVAYIFMALSDMVYEIWPWLGEPQDNPAIRFGLMGQRGPIDSILFVVPTMLLYHVIILAAMLYVRSVFKDLRNGGSPFSKKVGTAIAGLAGTFVGMGMVQQSLIMFFAAALVGLIYLIFDYGRILQEDADTTL